MTLSTVERDPVLERRCRRVGVPWDSPVVRYLLRLAPSSRRTQLCALRAAAGAFNAELGAIDWPTVDNAQLGALRAWLAERQAPATGNRILTAVRCVLHECARSGAITYDAFQAAVDIPPIRGTRLRKERAIVADEGSRLMEAARAAGGPHAARHEAMIALMWRGGLRREEVTSVRLSDIDEGAEEIRVRGKGNKERRVPLPPKTLDVIRKWIEIRGRTDGYLFCPARPIAVVGWRVYPKRKLSTTIVYRVLQELAARAKVAHLSPHDLRATYCGDLLDEGVDLSVVQYLMGHTDPQTTSGYDRRGARSRRAAVQKLSEPF